MNRSERMLFGSQSVTSKLVKQTKRCTYRTVHSDNRSVDEHAVRLVIDAVEYTMSKRRLKGHLMVSIVSESLFEEDGAFTLSLFQPEVNQIVAAGLPPLEVDATHEEWLAELQVSLIARVIEYEIELSRANPFPLLRSPMYPDALI